MSLKDNDDDIFNFKRNWILTLKIGVGGEIKDVTPAAQSSIRAFGGRQMW